MDVGELEEVLETASVLHNCLGSKDSTTAFIQTFKLHRPLTPPFPSPGTDGHPPHRSTAETTSGS